MLSMSALEIEKFLYEIMSLSYSILVYKKGTVTTKENDKLSFWKLLSLGRND